MTKIISPMAARKESERFLKFLVVGGIGFVVDALTFFTFTSILRFIPFVAQAFSFLAAVVSNFTWNRYWTYPDSRSKRIRKQLTQFTLVNLVGLGVRSGVWLLIHRPFQTLAASQTLLRINPDLIADYGTLATSVTVVLFWNFFVNRYWTYNDVG